MSGAKGYTPFSAFWGLFIPAVLIGLAYYGYTQPGFMGSRFQRLVGPIFDPAIKWFERLF